jgi:hypothetical protein
VVDHVVGFDAECVLDELGGAVAVVAADVPPTQNLTTR